MGRAVGLVLSGGGARGLAHVGVVKALREAGVPVVVSMSDVAASGGYWISMGADRVLASPATITGSIGIYGGKYVLQGLNGLAGLTVEPVERGANAGNERDYNRLQADVQFNY